jgi:peptidoglycan/LPS O-acetylase OafA/YrhL
VEPRDRRAILRFVSPVFAALLESGEKSIVLVYFVDRRRVAPVVTTEGHEKPEANFYLLPTRIWELLAGSLIALWCANNERRLEDKTTLKSMLALTGMSLIAYAIFRFDENTPFPGFYALVPVVGAALVIAFSRPGCPTGKLLTSKPFLGIGLISYSA